MKDKNWYVVTYVDGTSRTMQGFNIDKDDSEIVSVEDYVEDRMSLIGTDPDPYAY